MIFREIEFGSDDYRKECELRNKVLRIPLGRSLYDEDLSSESQQMHFGIFDERNNLVASVIAVNISSTQARIRQMAVDTEYQGKGYGRVHFFMHARMSAVGFYEKLGYARVGQEFMEVGLPHVKMEKSC